MSAGAEYWVVRELLEDLRLSHGEFRILMFLAKKARNGTHDMFWGERRIASTLGCSQGSVSKAVKKFAGLNLLHIKKELIEGSKFKMKNTYFLHVPYEYRRRGHKAVNGESIPEDFDPLTGEFRQEAYDERIEMDFLDEKEMVFNRIKPP